MRFRGMLSAALAAAAVMSSAAVTSVIPNGYDALNAGATFLGPLVTSGRTYQWLIRDDQLTAHVGRVIKGMAFRLPASATGAWPTADVTYASFDVRLSDSVLPANRSLTFASNIVGSQTLVRTGGLVMSMNSYAFGSSPNAFGPYVDFPTGYLYPGGNLLIEIRHTGFTGTSRSNDAIAATNGPAGVYAQQVSACWNGSATATTGSQGNFAVLKLTSDDAAIHPSSYEVTSGFEISGDLNSLFASDDNCLGVFPDDTTLVASVEINGTSGIQVPTSLKFNFEGSVARFGLAQSIALRNYTTATWVEVDGRVAPTTDTAISVTMTSTAPDFVGPSGALGARVTWSPINDEDPSQDGWLHCIDLASWMVQ